MASQRTTFDKLQRERAKKAKAAAKRERRQQRSEDRRDDETTDLGPPLAEGELPSAQELMARIEALHQRYEKGTVTFEDFEEQRAELYEQLSQLPMD